MDLSRARLFAAAVLFSLPLIAQTNAPVQALPDIDPAIARMLAGTPAYDNHAHTVLPPPQDAADRDFDALPVDNMEPQTDSYGFRDGSPQLLAAYKALWNVDATAGVKQVEAARAAVKRQQGEAYDGWVLSQAGIVTQVANRVSMTPALAAPAFRWVPYADALVFPLNNAHLAAKNPDRTQFFALEDKLRARYLQHLGLHTMPATLDAYLQQVVSPLLERQRAAGAVAEKFEIAYLRSFGFDDVPREEAAGIYAAAANGSVPNDAAYRRLQDFLFRFIAAECGRLGMAVHLHTATGGGGYFDIAGANPLLLEPLFDDPHLRRTRFVMLHGGDPAQAQATALLQKPNAWLDLSAEALSTPPRALAITLRERLESFPGKVLFGTDGYPYSSAMGWEESTWIGARTVRTALGIALTGMLRDGEVDGPEAAKLARMVLHDNAAELYDKPAR